MNFTGRVDVVNTAGGADVFAVRMLRKIALLGADGAKVTDGVDIVGGVNVAGGAEAAGNADAVSRKDDRRFFTPLWYSSCNL